MTAGIRAGLRRLHAAMPPQAAESGLPGEARRLLHYVGAAHRSDEFVRVAESIEVYLLVGFSIHLRLAASESDLMVAVLEQGSNLDRLWREIGTKIDAISPSQK